MAVRTAPPGPARPWLLGRLRIPEKYFLWQAERLLDGREISEVTPREVFASVDDDFWLWALGEGRRRSAALREILPDMPAEDLQLISTGNAGDAALEGGYQIYRLFRSIYRAYGGDLGSADAILDFGCGWGRVIRFFLKDVEPDHLWGIDHYDKMIEACRKTNRWGNFERIKSFPPTGFADGTFDLVYCYSVFSHLAEGVHRQWVDEFARILKPGGLLIATTWDRELIERCARLRGEGELPFYQAQLQMMFQDTDAWLERYDRGEFCFDNSTETHGGISWYGEACISKKYVVDHWSQRLDILDYLDDRGVSPQNVIVARR